MTRLGINIDHIATLRQARREGFPDPVQLALVAVKAGADGITAHLREDRRHIQDEDIFQLKKTLPVPLNLEMAATDEITKMACEFRPAWCCLVPEKRQELTTEGGLNVLVSNPRLEECIKQLKLSDIGVSLFVDPDPAAMGKAKDLGADAVEIHTGAYARAAKFFSLDTEACTGTSLAGRSSFKHELDKIIKAAQVAESKKLLVNAGHGLDYNNVQVLMKAYPFNELNIGFSVVAKSVEIGWAGAVQEMKNRIKQSICVES